MTSRSLILTVKKIPLFILVIGFAFSFSCNEVVTNSKKKSKPMKEKQITFNDKTHSLDNNDNFSPDGKYLCYDTRGMVFNDNLANCKSVEKVEIATGKETVLWKPESVTGENGAPGVAAVSYHPSENKVIFIHGPFLDEVEVRGYYDIRNRNGIIVDGDGNGELTKVDLRDVSTDKPTIPGSQRGGTHRHEYSRNGKRIGFTYDDFLQPDYDRTIGYMEENLNAPKGYTHYFTVLLKPAKEGTSKPGEIEKAYSDSWLDSAGTKRAFIGKVRSKNGVDYETSLFVAEIPEFVDITTAFSGTKDEYPSPPKDVKIKRLTHSRKDDGIVRGSYDGKRIAYLSEDENGIKQVFVIATDGSDLDKDPNMNPKQITNFDHNASNIRWYPSDNWVFSISNGNIYAIYVGEGSDFGRMIPLTNDEKRRGNLVVSPNGKMIAYNVKMPASKPDVIVNGKVKDEFDQIFIMELKDLELKE